MKYTVEGKVFITIAVEVTADDEFSAKKAAEDILKDSYNLNTYGYQHSPDSDVEFDLDAFEEYPEDEESPE